jgi:Tol biopolymer transport system component
VRRIVLLLLLGLAVATASSAGDYSPPPVDFAPRWSADGTRLAFETNRDPTGLGVVNADGSGEGRLFLSEQSGLVVSPDWSQVAYTSDSALWVSGTASDSAERRLATCQCRRLSWSPDSDWIAVATLGGGVIVVGADGTALWTISATGYEPTWSPDSAHIAYLVRKPEAGKVDLHVISPDGSGEITVSADVPESAWEPSWAPDGSKLAFWSRAWPNVDLNVVGLDGTHRSYRISDPIGDLPSTPNWSPDGNTISYSQYAASVHEPALYTITLSTGAIDQISATGRDPVFSPDGARIAFTDGGECRDRYGVYVVDPDGTDRQRLTNDCRVLGTAGNDVLHGSYSQVVLGLAGNDRLYADDSAASDQGNTLDGGPGRDRLYGGQAEDTLIGGEGDDTLSGGRSGDTLIGGPGRDRIDGQGGEDVIRAADRQRDSIRCGTGRDIVYADRTDLVATDCEIRRRS